MNGSLPLMNYCVMLQSLSCCLNMKILISTVRNYSRMTYSFSVICVQMYLNKNQRSFSSWQEEGWSGWIRENVFKVSLIWKEINKTNAHMCSNTDTQVVQACSQNVDHWSYVVKLQWELCSLQLCYFPNARLNMWWTSKCYF